MNWEPEWEFLPTPSPIAYWVAGGEGRIPVPLSKGGPLSEEPASQMGTGVGGMSGSLPPPALRTLGSSPEACLEEEAGGGVSRLRKLWGLKSKGDPRELCGRRVCG